MILASPSIPAQLFGSGLIGVREGLETGIVVMVLIAFLVKSDRRDAVKWIWLGVAGAVAMVVAIFLIIHFGTSTVSTLTAELIAGLASLLAVAIVTFMVLWMSKASAHISSDLKAGMSTALLSGGWAVAGMAFLAVGREGFETALLMVGYAESVSGGLWPLLGLLLGVLVAIGVTVLLYRGAVHLNFHEFFLYTGIFLIFVAAGILGYGVHALQTVGWLPGGANLAFDISAHYDQSSWYGTLVAGIFNFRPDPTVAQVVAWTLYVVVVLTLFLRANRIRPAARPSDAPSQTPATPDAGI
ncbi:iron uptake transporter permease EfeU [Gordonia sp. NB41Y]|uniref:iron uptake transporter permease EfeU n=1 Tax=Gordonia sp. NB41Y TaxID=875808 RepID=UPI0006B1B1EC|nr:iron uptake transporter permease EfeU [Gordonia sp. NB41Y]EMP14522.2 iron transporter [Gordonia sp. NB41Y]WLP90281.1 iron uptake transporter permease EfeU [Gordonia sp. NB41Y]